MPPSPSQIANELSENISSLVGILKYFPGHNVKPHTSKKKKLSNQHIFHPNIFITEFVIQLCVLAWI